MTDHEETADKGLQDLFPFLNFRSQEVNCNNSKLSLAYFSIIHNESDQHGLTSFTPNLIASLLSITFSLWTNANNNDCHHVLAERSTCIKMMESLYIK